MSALARTALRLAGIAALTADPVINALCQGRVFDSRIESLTETEAVPVITVLTEEMEGDAFSANNGGPPFDDRCELVLEIALRAVVQEDGEAAYIGTPATNAELEAALDLLEHRSVDALTIGDSPESRLVRLVTRRVSKQKSTRFVDAETGIKLAERTVCLSAELKGDDQEFAGAVGDPLLDVIAGAGNHGDGAVTAGEPAADATAIAGDYDVQFTDAERFTVADPLGSVFGHGAVALQFADQVHFTLTAGATPFAAGDRFLLSLSPGPFAGLPEPLRSVALALPEGSAGREICRQIAEQLAPAPAPILAGIDATYAPQPRLDPELPPLPAADTGAHDTFEDRITIP